MIPASLSAHFLRPAPRGKLTAKGRQVGPDYIRVMAVFVTDQCNLRCKHCYFFEQDGYEVLKALQDDATLNELPVIVSSS